MISVKNIAGTICFFAYNKTTEKENCRRAEEKEALGKSASCEYTGEDEMKIVATVQRGRSLSVPESLQMEKYMLDKDIREPLFDFLEEFYGKIRIFEEKVTGISRTDALGVIDGQLIGFEIKSDSDTYTRLKRQTADYDLLCDVNYLVVGKSHRRQADQHIPAHWGIICVYEEDETENEMAEANTGKGKTRGKAGPAPDAKMLPNRTGEEISEINMAADIKEEKLPPKEKKKIIVEIDQIPGVNPNVRLERQLDLLWRPELATLQEWNEMPKYAQKSKAFVREKILERVPQDVLKRQITDLLFERDYEALLAQIREVQKKTRPRKRKMSKKRSVVKAVRKKRRAAAK